MRVIAGTYKGHTLKAVPGMNTRPTTDKVKEAVFHRIGPFFNGGLGLDLFAGSGGLGIEALSRGLDRCIFVDHNGKSIQIIKENISALRISEEKVEIYKADAKRALKACAKRELQFDLIMLDPPYKLRNHMELVEQIENLNLLKESGMILCEHDAKDVLSDTSQFSIWKREEYGMIGVTIFQKRL
ncbi:MAG TPA: 16S rRNA (guanine(966)-N(2))-methyltransferase RsmD [Bacillus sp. (in: firmicutes)]|uniref:16S rRNA (guanine(966)-N(2))-methyltransferase RsmD n=1 Tax=Bacillus litorisediminis TaxID=2922713 RepID=UPI001FAE28FD|nr:16S rRNA (guanine(966)-N(2))-methyltransferase RsmD [Bacillus litorisediminis]HWO74817.1 16S rRNA (guanine(966)-N(2))-methyltransferase RsmD [Bacillus sp. (in: firmicutes)]